MRLQVGQKASFVGDFAVCSIAEGILAPHDKQLLSIIRVTAIPPELSLRD